MQRFVHFCILSIEPKPCMYCYVWTVKGWWHRVGDENLFHLPIVKGNKNN